MIYRRIAGENLYSKWHLMNVPERKDVIKQLCEILKIINNAPYEKFVKHFKLDSSINWHKKISSKIQNFLRDVETKKTISSDFAENINNFIKDNRYLLKEQRIALVYWDVHFDNILIEDNRVVGILMEMSPLSGTDFIFL